MRERPGLLANTLGQWRLVAGAFVLFVCIAGFQVGQARAGDPTLGGLCPEGYIENTNAGFSLDDVGCSICRPDDSCQAFCLTVPARLCPEGPSPDNESCCEESPCAGNCPEPDNPLMCSVAACVCEPEGCCTRVCPTQTVAPVTSWNGLALLATLLAISGVLYVRTRARA